AAVPDVSIVADELSLGCFTLGMVNWSRLQDVYGPAGDIPGLLDVAGSETSWDAPVWDELWGRLCHQGSVAPASYAALPALCHIAAARPDVATDPALFLAAAILSSADGPLPCESVRAEHAREVEAMRPLARHKLGLVTDRTGFIYALQNVAVVEDLGVWQRELEGLAHQEVELECPFCGDHVYLELSESDSTATLDPDDPGAGTRLEPASQSDLNEPELTLLDLAGAHRQPQVQGQLLQVFGHFICPACSHRVRIAEALG
ncbi:MAG: hypothetical protein ACOYBY_19810, partial [Dermatophilaceae bacterium]